MQFYYVKSDLAGVPAGTVERFAQHKAAPLVLDGTLVPYDEKKHAGKPGADAVPEDQRASSGKCPICGK